MLRHFTDATGTPLLAVAGNVDDQLDAAGSVMLPGHRLVTAGGWQILLTHVVAPGPAAKGAARMYKQEYRYYAVVCHSSAGPVRMFVASVCATPLMTVATQCCYHSGHVLCIVS